MKTLAIVPARAGSKRVPRKNVRPIGGVPLVARAIACAMGSTRIDRVVVSSDDAEVLAIAATIAPELALERPAEIATDTAPAIEYVRHALHALEGHGEGPFDTVVIIQPSSPLTLAEDVDHTVDLLRASGADSAVTVMEVGHDVHPIKMKTMVGDKLVPYLEEERGRMMAHELGRVFVRNCAVYASKRSTIDAGEIIGHDSRGLVMPRERSVDINDELDFAFADFLWHRSNPR